MKREFALNAAADPNSGARDSELAIKLNKLFDTMHKAGEQPLSNPAAAAAITKRTGVPISAAYIWQLRSGIKTNPTVQHLRAIAEFFGVQPSYLIDPGPDPRMDAQLTLLRALRDTGVKSITLRAAGLTPASLETVAAMLDGVRKLENLPSVPPPDENGT